MSGGHFDYQQYRFNDIAETIRGDLYSEYVTQFTDPSTAQQMRNAITLLQIASIYINRIDWLLSGDDSEETFHVRLEKELAANPDATPVIEALHNSTQSSSTASPYI